MCTLIEIGLNDLPKTFFFIRIIFESGLHIKFPFSVMNIELFGNFIGGAGKGKFNMKFNFKNDLYEKIELNRDLIVCSYGFLLEGIGFPEL